MKLALLKAKDNRLCYFCDKFSGCFGFGHAALLLSDGRALTSEPFHGVVLKKLKSHKNYHLIDLYWIEDEQKVIDFYNREKGCGYSYRGVFNFLVPFIPCAKGSWFCSELVMAALQSYGIKKWIKPFYVSPNDLFLIFNR